MQITKIIAKYNTNPNVLYLILPNFSLCLQYRTIINNIKNKSKTKPVTIIVAYHYKFYKQQKNK